MNIKKMTAQYTREGIFRGLDKEATKAGIQLGETVVVMKKSQFRRLLKLAEEAEHANRNHQFPA